MNVRKTVHDLQRVPKRANPYAYARYLKRLSARIALRSMLARLNRAKWLFRLWYKDFDRRYIGRYAPQTCPRRILEVGPWSRDKDSDFWIPRPNGDSCCSFCGSAHPDVFFRVLNEAADPNSSTYISLSDKRYKIYLQIDGVVNAMEGPIKFYTQHLADYQDFKDRRDEWNALFVAAVQASNTKLMERMSMRAVNKEDAD